MGILNKLYKSKSSDCIKSLPAIKSFEPANKKSLFVVLSRYGDAIIAFSIIKEFIEKYTPSFCTIITSNQLIPYAKELLPTANIKSFNKNSPISLIRTLAHIRSTKYDIGLNPHSFGSESEYLISFCEQFSFFKQHSHIGNLYNKNRLYMGLEKKSDFQTNKLPKECKKVVICPETTEDRKAFRRDELQLIIQSLKSKYTNPEITLAVSNKKSRYFLEGHKHFFFKKNEQSSLKFLHLLKESDLIVSVDSGPLHLAKALSKSTVALFACTAPEIIIDDFSYITPIRTNKLNQIQCENKFCKEPLCLIELFSSNILGQVYTPKQKIITYSKECCPYKEECAETWQVEI